MILRRFYDAKLAQASYLVGCAATGEACVIDPNRDIDQYIRAAQEEGLSITAVTETHIHADYVSGSRELASVTGSRLYLSDEGGPDWQYAFRGEDNVTLVRDGDSIRVGNVRLDVIHSPGHTPEHISFLLTDEPAGSGPLGMFTGDFVFVGDVGRPDLLERAANYEGTMVEGAKRLFRSIRATQTLAPHLLIWPAHGAGSACGKSLGGVPVTSVGYERISNWAFKISGEDEFVSVVLEGQPEPPAYFKHMKRINKEGPAFVSTIPLPQRCGNSEIVELVKSGGVVVDIRAASLSSSGFIPGTLTIPMAKGFPNWAGWLLPYDRPICLIAEDWAQVVEAVKDLRSVGLDQVVGWFEGSAVEEWKRSGGPVRAVEQIEAESATNQYSSGRVHWLDVRGLNEFRAGHVQGAQHIPLGTLPDRIHELPTDKPIVVQCQSGYRSSVAVSILERAGICSAMNLVGGYPACEKVRVPG